MENLRTDSLVDAYEKLSYLERVLLEPIRPDIRIMMVELYTDFIHDCEEASLEMKGLEKEDLLIKKEIISLLNRYDQFRRDAAKLVGEERVEEIFGLEKELYQLKISLLGASDRINYREWLAIHHPEKDPDVELALILEEYK